MKGFKDFILRGNVAALAVAFVIGGAFGALVQGFVKDLVTPLINIAGGGRRSGNPIREPRAPQPAADGEARGAPRRAIDRGADQGVSRVPQQDPGGSAALRLLHRVGAPGRSRTDTVAGFKPAASTIGPRGRGEGNPATSRSS